MPCPLFEPREKVIAASESVFRFPLIFEFTGVCHAGAAPESFRYCNHGNAKANCSVFPPAEPVSAIRFDVRAQTPQALTVLVLEEQDHWPRAWNEIEFLIATERLSPDISDTCRRSQFIHFCRSYLEKFHSHDN